MRPIPTFQPEPDPVLDRLYGLIAEASNPRAPEVEAYVDSLRTTNRDDCVKALSAIRVLEKLLEEYPHEEHAAIIREFTHSGGKDKPKSRIR